MYHILPYSVSVKINGPSMLWNQTTKWMEYHQWLNKELVCSFLSTRWFCTWHVIGLNGLLSFMFVRWWWSQTGGQTWLRTLQFNKCEFWEKLHIFLVRVSYSTTVSNLKIGLIWQFCNLGKKLPKSFVKTCHCPVWWKLSVPVKWRVSSVLWSGCTKIQ